MKNQITKIALLIILPGLFTSQLMAQKKMYASIDAGYGIKMGTQTLLYDSKSNNFNGSSTTTNKVKDVSFGKGFNFGAAFGYMFTKNVGAELGVSYLLGGKTKSTSDVTDVEGLLTSHRTGDMALSAKMFRIIPSVVIDAGLEKIDPYAKFGLVIGLGSIKIESNNNDNGDVTVKKTKVNGGVALSLSSAVGVKYNINDMMSVFGELNMMTLSYSPSKGKITEYTENGVDQLPLMTTNEKEYKFVKENTYESSNPTPDSEPNKEMHQKFPFGNFGINLGFRINF
jgi:hypothetical protein